MIRRTPFVTLASWAVLLTATTSPAAPVVTSALPQQSPIDIRTGNVVLASLTPLQFQYGTGVSLLVTNTGSPDEHKTVRADVLGGPSSLTVGETAYNLLQFHFHTEAEHLFNGHRAAMEMHLVHQDPVTLALLVVGRLIEPGSANAALAPIFSALPPNPGDTRPVSNFNLAALIPGNLASFRYPGSLTTPPFDEGVSWVVLAEPLTLSPSQIDAFRQLFPDGDSREVQPLNGRVVLTDDLAFVIPEPATLMLVCLGSVGVMSYGRRWRKRA